MILFRRRLGGALMALLIILGCAVGNTGSSGCARAEEAAAENTAGDAENIIAAADISYDDSEIAEDTTEAAEIPYDNSEIAENITGECKFTLCSTARKYTTMTDGKYTTYWESKKIKNPWVMISSDTPMYGLYMCFRRMPDSYEIQVPASRAENYKQWTWKTIAEGDTRFQHAFVELDGITAVRIISTQTKALQMGFNEIFVFGKGEIPEWVQRWEETEEKADVMFLSAHPDDELLFMGGAIPTYDVAMDKRVIVVYLTWSNTTRRSELLNGLWTMGVRNYPVLGAFSDSYSSKAEDAYEKLGKQKVLEWITEIFRRYKPEVVVTHDLKGEYGHGQHKMMADACVQGYTLAADETSYPESAAQWGTWQVKKLYLHLYGEEEDQTRFDWTVPMECFGGKSSFDVACEAYLKHVTQESAEIKIRGKWHRLSMEETGSMYSNTSFGLYATEVGADETHTDFLEHLE